jgi:choline kinase
MILAAGAGRWLRPDTDVIGIAPIGAVGWVEVDNHDDLRRAREIATLCR